VDSAGPAVDVSSPVHQYVVRLVSEVLREVGLRVNLETS
jgi:hypothetical protein